MQLQIGLHSYNNLGGKMTWKEFKDFVEKEGIIDDMKVNNISVDFSEGIIQELKVDIFNNHFNFFTIHPTMEKDYSPFFWKKEHHE